MQTNRDTDEVIKITSESLKELEINFLRISEMYFVVINRLRNVGRIDDKVKFLNKENAIRHMSL